MFPDKFLSHAGEYGIGSSELSFWVKYVGECPEDNGTDVIIEQQTKIFTGVDDDENPVYELRQILQGDTSTKFMTDLGEPTDLPFPVLEPGSVGMTRPSDNACRKVRFFGPGGYGSDMLAGVGFDLFHRNCFRLKEGFLTEAEWLARDDYRIVFLSVATNPDLVRSPSEIAQYGVHIFTDDAPFKPLDAEENVYSPALHCIPDGIVGGFQFGLDQEPGEDFFVLYDYKDWYPNEVGINIPSFGLDYVSGDNEVGCGLVKAKNVGSFPDLQPIATSYLLPNSDPNIPFQITRRLATPPEVWSIDVADYDQTFPESSGYSCYELFVDPIIPGFTFCEGSDSCHGTFDVSSVVGFGTLGNDNSLTGGDRTVEENHPCRNRLFVQGVFEGGSPGDKTYSVQMSEPGSDDFETATYSTFSGNSAIIIENSILAGYNIGRVTFAGGSLSDDPNPPTNGNGLYTSFYNEVTQSCGCASLEEPPGTLINLGRIQTVNPIAVNGAFGFRKRAATDFQTTTTLTDSFVEIGDPQFSFP